MEIANLDLKTLLKRQAEERPGSMYYRTKRIRLVAIPCLSRSVGGWEAIASRLRFFGRGTHSPGLAANGFVFLGIGCGMFQIGVLFLILRRGGVFFI